MPLFFLFLPCNCSPPNSYKQIISSGLRCPLPSPAPALISPGGGAVPSAASTNELLEMTKRVVSRLSLVFPGTLF